MPDAERAMQQREEEVARKLARAEELEKLLEQARARMEAQQEQQRAGSRQQPAAESVIPRDRMRQTGAVEAEQPLVQPRVQQSVSQSAQPEQQQQCLAGHHAGNRDYVNDRLPINGSGRLGDHGDLRGSSSASRGGVLPHGCDRR
eukprot:6044547-Pleurochrysis_carterae.AAC.1